MAVLAGIDEAGLGPKLGPLALGLTVFEGPASTLARLAESLVPVVGPTADAAVPIGDSKQLYGSKRDIAVLERGVFACWLQWNEAWPGDLLGWLDALDIEGDAVARTRAYPWYREPLALPRSVEAGEVRAGAAMLAASLAKRRVRLCEMRATALCAQEINDGIREHGTKNVFNFFAAAPFIQHVFDHYADRDAVELVVDRQGGRKDYGSLLRQLLYPASVSARPIDDYAFGYRVWHGDRRMLVKFVTRADGQYLPVGLASMLAKYTRELHMELFNAFWRSLAPDVRPTAGYPTDAARFLEDIRRVRREVPFDAERLVRSR